jgi:Fimbrial assembly protein (PilN)
MEGSMKTMINLLPQSFRRQQIVRKRAVQWTSIISVVLATGWGWHWFELREAKELSQELEGLSREHAPTQTMLKQLEGMRHQLVELQQQESVAKELDCQRNALTVLGVVSDTARKTKGRLRLAKFDLSNFQSGQVGEGANGAKASSLVLSGVSLDNSAVAELLDGLQKSSIFSRVEVTLKEREDKDASLRDYEVRCEF